MRYWMTLSLVVAMTACGSEKDESGDTGASDADADTDADADADADTMSDAPGCDISGVQCYAFDGSAFAGMDVADLCSQLSEQVVAAGGSAAVLEEAGCPAGATSECTGAPIVGDQDGNPISGADVTVYFYAVDAVSAASSCTEMGGTFSEL